MATGMWLISWAVSYGKRLASFFGYPDRPTELARLLSIVF